jgi:hypothetical protein
MKEQKPRKSKPPMGGGTVPPPETTGGGDATVTRERERAGRNKPKTKK